MSDPKAPKRILLWWLYSLVGNPEEADYGPETPQGYGSVGLESQYRSPQIWARPEPRLVATKADYELVEPIYRKRDVRDRLTIIYYAGHPSRPITRLNRDVIESFSNEVEKL